MVNNKQKTPFLRINDRNANFELLRYISVLSILFIHYFQYENNGFPHTGAFSFIQPIFVQNFGIGVFLVLSGYFSATSNKTRVVKVATMLFWCYALYVITDLVIIAAQGGGNYLEAFKYLAIWWYFFAFVLLSLFTPMLNKILLNSNKYLSLFAITICLIWTTQAWLSINYFIVTDFFSAKTLNTIFIMSLVYCLGGWLRIYGNIENNKKLLVGAILYLVIYMLIDIIFFTSNGTILDIYNKWIFSTQSVFTFFLSASLLIIFANIKITKFPKFFNFLGMCTAIMYMSQFLIIHIIWNAFGQNIILTPIYSVLLPILCFVILTIYSSIFVLPVNYLTNVTTKYINIALYKIQGITKKIINK